MPPLAAASERSDSLDAAASLLDMVRRCDEVPYYKPEV
jgi:hypothetical protein